MSHPLKRKKEKLSGLLDVTYPMVDIFSLTKDVEEFVDWLQKEHGKSLNTQVLHGYKFFFECLVSSIIDDLFSEEDIGIKSDFLLQSSARGTTYIGKLPNSCPRTILLKNILYHFKPISKASNVGQLKQALQNFNDHVICVFEKLFHKHFELKKHPNISSEKLKAFFLMGKVYIYFNQVNNGGPTAYMGTLMKDFFVPKKKMEICFEGYKLAVQFAWYKLLGKRYRNSCLTELHETKTWRGIIYNEKEPEEEEDEFWYLKRTFNIDKQASFDAFFYRIKRDIILPLEKRYGRQITPGITFFNIDSKGYRKNIFDGLLKKELAKDEERSLSDDLDMLFYWYPIEINSNIDNASGAFVVTLAGCVALLDEKEREFNKVKVCKFIHPREDGDDGNDYSYAVLVDIKAAADHYSSEWFLYYDCCSDYSGFAGSLLKRIEEVLTKYVKSGLVELTQTKINHENFRNYIADYVVEDPHKDILESVEEVKEKMERVSEQNKLRALITDSQGGLLELATYYLVTKKKEYSRFREVIWNTSAPAGQIDIIMSNEKDVHIIECKLNPHTLNFDEEIRKLNDKIQAYQKPNKTYEFWFWHEPNKMVKETLSNKNIKYFSMKQASSHISSTVISVLNHSWNN